MSFAPNKTRIAILRGGPSFEYEHSLISGKTILDNLPENYHPLDVLVDQNGDWYQAGFKKSPEKIIQSVDLLWNMMHGYGEDGFVHKMAKDFSVPFVGSNHISSGVTQNKKMTGDVLAKYGIKTPYSILFEVDDRNKKMAEMIDQSMPFPIVIKPNNSGSSSGVSVVYSSKDLKRSIDDASHFSKKVLAQEFINGSVISSGILEGFRGDDHYPLMPFVLSGPDINEENKQKIKELAFKIHKILHLKDYSQSDFVVHPKRGVFFLEVNTIPKIHEESKFVSSLKSAGASIKDFVKHILDRVVKVK